MVTISTMNAHAPSLQFSALEKTLASHEPTSLFRTLSSCRCADIDYAASVGRRVLDSWKCHAIVVDGVDDNFHPVNLNSAQSQPYVSGRPSTAAYWYA